MWSWMSRVRISSLTPLKLQVRSPGQDDGRGSRLLRVRFWEHSGSKGIAPVFMNELRKLGSCSADGNDPLVLNGLDEVYGSHSKADEH